MEIFNIMFMNSRNLCPRLLILCYRKYFNYTFNVKNSCAIFKFGITKIEIPAFAGMTIIRL